jgi:hypothetical protein
MRIQRLDLGVDVVVVADADLVIIHPDLSFGEAVGAVMSVLPGLHPDAVVNLVSQVTQRPRAGRSARRRTAPLLAGAAAAVSASLVLAGVLLTGPDLYDQRWRSAVAALELDCRPGEDPGWTCVGADGAEYEVTAFSRSDGALYVMRSQQNTRYLRSFHGDIPAAWLDRNPNAVVVDSAAVVWE